MVNEKSQNFNKVEDHIDGVQIYRKLKMFECIWILLALLGHFEVVCKPDSCKVGFNW